MGGPSTTVKARVDRIPSFPAGAERPEVREVTSRQSVIRLLVHGDVPERVLKEMAYRIEDGIASLPEVSYVETSGVRDYEISIEVSSNRLRGPHSWAANAVRRGSTSGRRRDPPSGRSAELRSVRL